MASVSKARFSPGAIFPHGADGRSWYSAGWLLRGITRQRGLPRRVQPKPWPARNASHSWEWGTRLRPGLASPAVSVSYSTKGARCGEDKRQWMPCTRRRAWLLQAVIWRQVFGFGLDERHSHRLALGIDGHAQHVIHTPLGALARLARHNLDGPRRLLPTDEVFGPAAGVQGGINQLRTGIVRLKAFSNQFCAWRQVSARLDNHPLTRFLPIGKTTIHRSRFPSSLHHSPAQLPSETSHPAPGPPATP